MTRAEFLQQATLEARKNWLNYTIERENQIRNLLKSVANNIIEEMEKYVAAGKIPPARLEYLYANIKQELAILRVKLRDRIISMMSDSVDMSFKTQIEVLNRLGIAPEFYNIGSSFIDPDGIVHKWDARISSLPNSMWGQLNGNVIDYLINNNPAGLTLSNRIWDISWTAEKAIRNALSEAVIQGKSAASLSRTIRSYLYEPEMLFRRVRKDGKLVLSKAAAAYHPGQGVYRSSYKNAMRLARTEMARAYSEGTLRYGQQKDFIIGFIWRTGSGNPCPECSTLDGQYYPKGEEDQIPAHPHCMCWWEMVLAEYMNNLLDEKGA